MYMFIYCSGSQQRNKVNKLSIRFYQYKKVNVLLLALFQREMTTPCTSRTPKASAEKLKFKLRRNVLLTARKLKYFWLNYPLIFNLLKLILCKY